MRRIVEIESPRAVRVTTAGRAVDAFIDHEKIPASLEDAARERDDLIADMQTIESSLGEQREGVRAFDSGSRARLRRRREHVATRLRFLKAWIKERNIARTELRAQAGPEDVMGVIRDLRSALLAARGGELSDRDMEVLARSDLWLKGEAARRMP